MSDKIEKNRINPSEPRDKDREFSKTIEQKQKRKLSAKKHASDTVWFGLGMFGMVGWSVAIPSVAGAFLGIWVDRTWPGQASWTLTFLILGIILGCWNAWYWIKREGKNRE